MVLRAGQFESRNRILIHTGARRGEERRGEGRRGEERGGEGRGGEESEDSLERNNGGLEFKE